MTSSDALHYTGPHDSPAAHISLRAIDPERFSIVNEAAGGEVLEEIEESKAFWEVYDGAVYLFQVPAASTQKSALGSWNVNIERRSNLIKNLS